MSFIANHGQWDKRALFQVKTGRATTWFTYSGVYHQFIRQVPALGEGRDWGLSIMDQVPGRFERLTIQAVFVDANPRPQVRGEEILPHGSNYFIGSDMSAWRTDIPGYRRVLFRDVYPGIDLKYYGQGRLLEYDFVVSPGADYTRIRIEYVGAESLTVSPSGELVISTTWGEVTERAPVAYQNRAEGRLYIEAAYELASDNSFGFKLTGGYDPAVALIIDPVLTYSSYLGGDGSDEGFGIAADAAGSAYVVGYCLSDDFPTQDPYQTDMGGYDVFVAKLNAVGDDLVYSTYLGGSDDDWGSAVALDADGNAYITGHTSSDDFPTQSPYQSGLGGEGDDAFVAKLNPAGNGLIFSTYLGGDDEDRGHAIAVGDDGGAFVTGYTSSTDFPTQNPYQALQGNRDAFVTRLNATGDGLIYSTYVGGADYEEGRGLAVDADGQAHIVGYTSSLDYPTQVPYQSGFQGGGYDAFVTKLNVSGDALIYSTYLGGTSEDQGRAIALDDGGHAYLTGCTKSSGFPTATAYQTFQGEWDAFVTKITPAGDALVYSTYLGGDGYEEGLGIAVNVSGGAFVTGTTSSTDFPTVNPLQATFLGGGHDAFVASFNLAGDGLVYGTFVGGDNSDRGNDIAIDPTGNAYLTGTTASDDLSLKNPLQPALEGISDAFVMRIDPDNYPPIAMCRDIALEADVNCEAYGSIDNGSYDPDGDLFTITLLPPEPYPLGETEVILRITDSTGLWNQDRATVTVTDNLDPVVSDGPGPITVECAADVPLPDPGLITAVDNCDTELLIEHVDDASDAEICPETITRRYAISDDFGNTVWHYQTITVRDENSPWFTSPGPQAHFLCEDEEVCVPLNATDRCDPNPVLTVESGPGQIVDGQWCYTPATSETADVTIRATDFCGNFREVTFYVDLTVNSTPRFTNCPEEQVYIPWGGTFVYDFEVDDPDPGQTVTLSLCDDPPAGITLDPVTGHLEMTVCTPSVCLIATDECGATDDCTFEICMTNEPPVLSGPGSQIVCHGSAFETQLIVTDPDIGASAIFSITSGPAGIEVDEWSGAVYWAEPEPGAWDVCVEAAERAVGCDLCNPTTADTACFVIEVVQLDIVIEKVSSVGLGQFVDVSVDFVHQGDNWPVAGFDALFEYSVPALSFLTASPGRFFQDCEWEYFAYRFGPEGDCGDGICPAGVVRVVALAESTFGSEEFHPDCFVNDGVADPGPGSSTSTQLAVLSFVVTTDWASECKTAPIRFLWYDCGDNGFSDVPGGRLFSSYEVFDYAGTFGEPPVVYWNDITGLDDVFPTVTGVPLPRCETGEEFEVVNCIGYYHGGIDIECSEAASGVGDINQNKIPYEIADAIMFTNFFLEGLAAFGDHVSESVAASDTNQDGVTLSVSDLVYLIRVVVGNTQPQAKTTAAKVRTGYVVDEGILSVADDVAIGAAALVVRGEIEPELLVNGMDMGYFYDGANTRVVVTPALDASTVNSFQGAFLAGITGELLSLEMATPDGVSVIATNLPREHRLGQNRPNPFNPSTTIGFSVPARSRVNIEVFNVLGHSVTTLINEVRTAGEYKVIWNGTDDHGRPVASGVYLYRLTADDHVETNKMLLLK